MGKELVAHMPTRSFATTRGAASGGVTSITGTANQVIASAATGAVTLSTPQDIATTSTVNFGRIILTPQTDAVAITVTGTNVTSANLINLDARNTSGTLVNVAYGAGATLAGATTGQLIDLKTNVANTTRNVTGEFISLPAITGSTGSTQYGLRIDGDTVTNTSGTMTWAAININQPVGTFTAGTLNVEGVTVNASKITGPGGFVNAFGFKYVSAGGLIDSSGVLDTINGLYIVHDHNTTGTISNAFGVQIGYNAAAGSTFTTETGVAVVPTGSGTVTNFYGFRIQAGASFTSTTARGLAVSGVISRATNAFALDVTNWLNGTLVNLTYPGSTTQTGAVTGMSLDMSSNFTILTGKDITGTLIKFPAASISSGTLNYNGLLVSSPGALTTNPGAINWTGANITMPTQTQTSGTVTTVGVKITGGTVNSGTAYAITADASSGNIGFGLTAPAAKLDILDTSNTQATLGVTNNTATTIGAAAYVLGVVNVLSSSVTTGNLVNIGATGLTTGFVLNVSSTSTAGAASGTSYVLNVVRSGANANTAHTAYGLSSAVTNTNATSGTNIAAYLTASGATTANYGLIVAAGNVGMGTTAPVFDLDLEGGGSTLRATSTVALGSGSGGVIVGFAKLTPTAINQRLASFFGASFSTGTTVVSSAGMSVFANEAWSSTAAGAYLQFETTTNGTVTRTARCLVSSTGNFQPITNKTGGLGITTVRWAASFLVSNTTGTSRLTKAMTVCPECGESMTRGTGTSYILGNDGDYIQIWCEDCGVTKMEKINHLSDQKRASALPAPTITFRGFRVMQLSGNSRMILVDFKYGEGDSALYNSTVFGDTEVAEFKQLSTKDQRQFLQDLGQREWDALEEMRLLEEQIKEEQSEFDQVAKNFMDQDLSRPMGDIINGIPAMEGVI